MSIFNRIPLAERRKVFTHKGWLGFCPVWLDINGIAVTERNWVPEWLMWLNLYAQDFASWCIEAMGGESAPGWAIRVTGKLPT